MKVLVGLGNPEDEFRPTRHNVGYRVAEEILRRGGDPYEERKARSLVGRVRIGDQPVVIARPLTWMNRSGVAVADLLEMAETGPEDLLVVCDDLYLDLGTIRLRPRGGHGGHNGLLSIITVLGTSAFPRLRVGIGPPEAGVAHADFVLAPFRRREEAVLSEVVKISADCAEVAVTLGVAAAMNRFNRTTHESAVEEPD